MPSFTEQYIDEKIAIEDWKKSVDENDYQSAVRSVKSLARLTLSPFFPAEKRVDIFLFFSQRALDKKYENFRLIPALFRIAEALSMTEAETLFQYFRQKLRDIESSVKIDQYAQSECRYILVRLARYVNTATVRDLEFLKEYWLPWLWRKATLWRGVSAAEAMLPHMTQDFFEEAKLFHMLLNVGFQHYFHEALNTLLLFHQFYAPENLIMLDKALRKTIRLCRGQQSQGWVRLIKLMPIFMHFGTVLEFVQKYEIISLLISGLQNPSHDHNEAITIREHVLSALNFLASSDAYATVNNPELIALIVSRLENNKCVYRYPENEPEMKILASLILRGIDLRDSLDLSGHQGGKVEWMMLRWLQDNAEKVSSPSVVVIEEKSDALPSLSGSPSSAFNSVLANEEKLADKSAYDSQSPPI